MKKSEEAAEPPAGAAVSPTKWYHINRQFLPIKLLYFWGFAGGVAVLPLLTLHMTHIGLTLQDIAQVYVFMPVASFMGPPVIGYIADRTGWIRQLYVFCLVSTCLGFNSLYFLVPTSPETTPQALAKAVAPVSLPCADWPAVLCSNFTRNYRCTLSCPDGDSDLPEVCPGQVCSNTTLEPEANVTSSTSDFLMTLNSRGCLRLPSNHEANDTREQPLPENATHLSLACPSNCQYRCQPDGPKPQSNRKTFWTYFFLRLVTTFFLAPSFTLLDATNLAIVAHHKTPGQNFGRQRVMAIVASVITPPLTGSIVDMVSEPGSTNYSPAFYVGIICTCITIITLYVFKLHIALPEKAHIRQASKVLRQPEAMVFILVVAVLGSMWGFLENFLFVFLRELNAPNYLLGLTLTVAGLASVPFNWWSEAIVHRLGHVNILIIAFFGYAIRYIGYSFMTNPWYSMPFELMEVVTTHLMWNSAASYAGQLAPPGLLATLIGLAGALHYSFGRGVGSFIGGYLMAVEGSAFTYRAMGVTSGVCGVLYTLVYYGFLRRHISRREERRRAKLEEEAKRTLAEGPDELAAMMEEHAIAGV